MSVRKISLAFVVVLVSSAVAVCLTGQPTTVEPPKPLAASVVTSVDADEESTMIELTNEYRASHGLVRLSVNDNLMASAQVKADDLCEAGNWSHSDSRGREFFHFISESGYNYHKAGENLSRGFSTQPEAFDALLRSPGHYANIVEDYKETGVGFSKCGGDNFTVIHYGTRS